MCVRSWLYLELPPLFLYREGKLMSDACGNLMWILEGYVVIIQILLLLNRYLVYCPFSMSTTFADVYFLNHITVKMLAVSVVNLCGVDSRFKGKIKD